MNAYHHGCQPLSGLPPTKYIQVRIDDAVAQQSQPWRGSIPFKCHVISGEKGDPFIALSPLSTITMSCTAVVVYSNALEFSVNIQ